MMAILASMETISLFIVYMLENFVKACATLCFIQDIFLIIFFKVE